MVVFRFRFCISFGCSANRTLCALMVRPPSLLIDPPYYKLNSPTLEIVNTYTYLVAGNYSDEAGLREENKFVKKNSKIG